MQGQFVFPSDELDRKRVGRQYPEEYMKCGEYRERAA